MLNQRVVDCEDDSLGNSGYLAAAGGACSRTTKPFLVSLFCGAGGLDLGFKDAGYSLAVAIDSSSAAVLSYRENFPEALAVVGDLTKLRAAGVAALVQKKVAKGERIGVIGGPPCQGFSRANAGSLADDPRNKLPQLYIKIVRELQKDYCVEFLVLENVPGIRDEKHSDTYAALLRGVKKLGFDVEQDLLCATDFGVPQTRRRVIVTGLRVGCGYGKVAPKSIPGPQTVREAIEGVPEPAFFRRGMDVSEIPYHPNNWTMQPKSPRFSEPLGHSSTRRSFKVLRWDHPSPTIAFGNREIHVHPSGRRRLSIHEAMLLQGFPSHFTLKGNLSEQVTQVSNAVPPPLAKSVAIALTLAMEGL